MHTTFHLASMGARVDDTNQPVAEDKTRYGIHIERVTVGRGKVAVLPLAEDQVADYVKYKSTTLNNTLIGVFDIDSSGWRTYECFEALVQQLGGSGIIALSSFPHHEQVLCNLREASTWVPAGIPVEDTDAVWDLYMDDIKGVRVVIPEGDDRASVPAKALGRFIAPRLSLIETAQRMLEGSSAKSFSAIVLEVASRASLGSHGRRSRSGLEGLFGRSSFGSPASFGGDIFGLEGLFSSLFADIETYSRGEIPMDILEHADPSIPQGDLKAAYDKYMEGDSESLLALFAKSPEVQTAIKASAKILAKAKARAASGSSENNQSKDA